MPKKRKDLVWNVYVENFNGREIETYNVFHHWRFWTQLVEIATKYKKDASIDFRDEVRRIISYNFWSKSEYETYITNNFMSITDQELKRLKEVDPNDYNAHSVNLEIALHIDIADQLFLNFDRFMEYLQANLSELRFTQEEKQSVIANRKARREVWKNYLKAKRQSQ